MQRHKSDSTHQAGLLAALVAHRLCQLLARALPPCLNGRLEFVTPDIE